VTKSALLLLLVSSRSPRRKTKNRRTMSKHDSAAYDNVLTGSQFLPALYTIQIERYVTGSGSFHFW
jgi:hypothetical protein